MIYWLSSIFENRDIDTVMKQLKLSVEKKSGIGRQHVRKLRTSGRIPAVVYGKSGTQSLSLNEKDFRLLLHEKGQSASLINIEIIGGESILSTIADMQRDPVTDRFLHVDFHEVSRTEKMTTTVPVEFVGSSIGVRDFGGVLDVSKHDLTVRCLPADLPGSIKIDVSGLQVGDIIHVKDLKSISGVEFVDSVDIVVVSCKSVNTDDEQVVDEMSGADTQTATTISPESITATEDKSSDAK